MKEFVLAGAAVALSAAAFLAAPAPAFAASADEQVSLCAAAADAQGIAATDAYRAKFMKSKGGAVQTVTIKLVPEAGESESITAECKIKRGEVIGVTVKA
ncbi:MAG TPA: hypothetical protein PLV61_08165 [Parvularculaceae bacterium]|nr:hypothetical protein [Caulobacterales bacterium]HOP20011.1 hypothetical protein [Amphiplicatus sp.]HPE31154.1 hypothetical protein [Parvularculaceae bacterium]HRX38087.1 hypothetical protein [Parvularculaceae bacterium]